jgi:hypothetical protein
LKNLDVRRVYVVPKETDGLHALHCIYNDDTAVYVTMLVSVVNGHPMTATNTEFRR